MDGHDKFKDIFDQYFGNYKNVPIGIYGTGQNAEVILNGAEGYDFFALIAAEHIGETRYGLEIISIEEAVKKAQMILIAAVPASTSIIYQRIRGIVPDKIPVFDMRGHQLRGDDYYKRDPYWKQTREELIRLIDGHSVISFDIFDTLLTRKTLLPAGVFSLVERSLREQGVEIPFASWRRSAEEACTGRTASPSIDMIYEELRREHGIDESVMQRAKDLELQMEERVVLPRRAMVEIFQYALKRNKAVYLTSDMYLPKERIQKLLEICGIRGYNDILVSCDYGVSKDTGGLYEVLRSKALGESILHIGDQCEADIRPAIAHGIDAYRVMSCRDMLSASSAAYLFDSVNSFDDSLVLGALAADFCNDPFALSPYSGKVQLTSYHELAMCFLPVTELFLSFIIGQAQKYDAILFPSRDGFFLHKLYCAARKKRTIPNLPEAFFVYASRSAVSSSAVFDEEGILVFCSKVFEDKQLNLKEFMRNQFQIEVSEEYNLTCGEAIEKWGRGGLRKKILSNRSAIFEKSTENRKKYLRYMGTLGLDRFEKIAVVDIVTHGTLVYGFSQILGKQIHLISMGTSVMPNDYIRDLRCVSSMWGNINEKWLDSTYSLSDFSQLHLFLEMIYASDEGQFWGFSEAGEALTLSGTEYNLELVRNTQKEMGALIERHSEINWGAVSKEFALSMLRLLYGRYASMSDDLREKFSFSDPYDGSWPICNLMDCLGG